MSKYHGRAAVVYISTTGSGAAVNVANLSEWSLNMATDRVEVTCFGDANKTYVQGLKDVTGTFKGFFDDVTTANLYTGSTSTDGVKMYLYVASTATTRYFYGPAWLDISVSTPINGAVSVSGTFAANGSWGALLA